MRWIFFSLVLANLALLGYFTLQPNETPVPTGPQKVHEQGKKLILLSEAADPQVMMQETQVVASESAGCYQLGPFMSLGAYNQAQARAAALGLEFREVFKARQNTTKPLEYWVHVPSRPTQAEARKLLAELKQRKVDSFLITKGDMANAISLGLFRNKASAERISQLVKDLGIPVAIKVKNDVEGQRWLRLFGGAGIGEGLRERVMGASEGVRWSSVDCQS